MIMSLGDVVVVVIIIIVVAVVNMTGAMFSTEASISM